MNLILFDDPAIRINLLPFTYTRPAAKIRVGILTIDEKWERWLKVKPSFQTEEYLQKKYPLIATDDNLLVNGALCPDEKLVARILALQSGQYLVKDKVLLAARNPKAEMSNDNTHEYSEAVTLINHTWKIFSENGKQIKIDFVLVTSGRKSAGIQDKHTTVYGEENLFVEDGVYVRAAIINAEPGPVYLGKNSIIQEGAIIRGSFALCEGGHINMGGKIRGDVTVGPFSKVGGEVSTSVVFGYSNKAHDGFMGCSVMGEWCNLGADTNTSNLKNNYDTVKVWSHAQNDFINSGLLFCGLMMGDHSKCGINTMFNTGTVIDVSSNVFGEGFPPNYIPSFGWGAKELTTYKLDKALVTAEKAMGRRNIPFNEIERDIMTRVFEITAANRNWEKK
ncbi:MAG TPA: GlmU family protein [Cyclobacteriaceae bacterium]|jgi:UDP-N-acetylglucosamine diphosphorylase/glucosamine-1-phosphate N-acetyltransferase|nr:GlmU family protein [Cyclobacteriaceae bacterium]